MSKTKQSKTTAKSDKRNSKVARRTLHYFWEEIKHQKKYTIGVLILLPITVIVGSILGPLFFADMINKVSLGIPTDELLPTLLPEAILYLFLFALNNLIFTELHLFCHWRLVIYGTYNLADRSFTTVSSQSMQFHNNRFAGSLVSQVSKFIGAFENFVDVLFFNVFQMLVNIIAIMIVLFPIIPIFALILVVIIIAYTIVAFFAFRHISHLNKAEADAFNRRSGQLSDSITNILAVKSNANEPFERRRFGKYQRETAEASNNVMTAMIKRNIAFGGINIVLTACLLFFLIFGSSIFGLSIAVLILLVNYSSQIFSQLWNMNNIFRGFNHVFGDAASMTEILDTTDTVVDAPDAKKLQVHAGAISFDRITFQHQDAKTPLFKDFTLAVRPGERIGLVGVSGSGKTTLTKLLLRFADVNQGEIAIDGQNIKQVTQSSLRQNIAYVPQETTLFHRSIADNIAYAKPHASRQEIVRAAKLANAHEFVKDLPEGYNTLTGERGVKLSGGQRQRVAIAHAILKDAPILVLDEATSALDSESEALIQDALKKLMQDRTCVVVAHRLSTVANLDRIVVLKQGKIIEQGTHEELLKNVKGTYYRLWNRQSGAFLNK